jgi:hypothetical protein
MSSTNSWHKSGLPLREPHRQQLELKEAVVCDNEATEKISPRPLLGM